MRNGLNLAALNEYLFEALDRVTNDDLTGEDFQREIARSQAVVSVAETVIRTGDLMLKAFQTARDYKVSGAQEKLPAMLEE